MFHRWFAAGLMCLVVTLGEAQDSTEREDAVGMSSELVERLFEMAENDSGQEVRRVALDACWKLSDQRPRFAATIDRMLDSPDRAKRADAALYLDKVDLSPERKAAAAIRDMRDLYIERKVIPRNPVVLPVLRQHSEVALGMIVKHLEEDGDLPLLYLDLADKCGLDVEQSQTLLIKYSQSQDAEVRRRVAQLLSNRLSSQIRKRESEQRRDDSSDRPEKYYEYAKRIIARYDQDASGSLQEAEWERMLISPSPADANKDGELTAQEYSDYLIKKANR